MENLEIDLTKFSEEDQAIVYYEDDEKCHIVKYKDLYQQILRIGEVLSQENLSRNEASAIGIFCTKSPATVALCLAILESGFGFCNLTSEHILSLDDLGIKYFFSDSQWSANFSVHNSFELFGKTFRLYKTSSQHPLKIFDDGGDKMNRICYTIKTSGSTGKRKIVRVPYNCIKPNISSLQKIFRLSRQDKIFSSAPCTFDVFILDVFLALHTGSTLLILNDSLRYSEKAIDILHNVATFMQITPSLFKNYGLEIIQSKILHKNSSLR